MERHFKFFCAFKKYYVVKVLLKEVCVSSDTRLEFTSCGVATSFFCFFRLRNHTKLSVTRKYREILNPYVSIVARKVTLMLSVLTLYFLIVSQGTSLMIKRCSITPLFSTTFVLTVHKIYKYENHFLRSKLQKQLYNFLNL